MSSTKKHTIEDIYEITLALLTDNDTTFINGTPVHLIKTIPGTSYLLTIYTPIDAITHIINNGKPSNKTENAYTLQHGPRGKITLHGNGRLIGEYTTKKPVAPCNAEKDNFIKRFIRKTREGDFFRIVDLVNCRDQGKIVLRDNTRIFQELLKSQRTK